jgi:hypothetical protein
MGTIAISALPATAPRTVVADPDRTPDSSGVEPGGILVFTNRSGNSSMFEIMFFEGDHPTSPGDSDNPASPGDLLIGTEVVVIHVPKDRVGTFKYKIRHIKNSGDFNDSKAFAVHSCIGC